MKGDGLRVTARSLLGLRFIERSGGGARAVDIQRNVPEISCAAQWLKDMRIAGYLRQPEYYGPYQLTHKGHKVLDQVREALR